MEGGFQVKCADMEALFDALIDGELTNEQRRTMDEHAAHCPECAQKLRAAMQLKAILGEALPEADVPLAAQAKWRGAVRAEASRRQRNRWTRAVGAIAAALVLVAGVGFALNGRLNVPKDELIMTSGMVVDDKSAELTADGDVSENEIPQEEVGREIVFMESALQDSGADEGVAADELLEDNNLLMDAETAIIADEFAEASSAMVEADGLSEVTDDEPMMEEELLEDGALEDMLAQPALFASSAAPMLQWHMRVKDLDAAYASVIDLMGEYEGTVEEQPFEGGANLYITLPAEYLADFASAAAHLDVSEEPEEAPEAGEGDVASLLLVLELMD